jgi:tetratricopeptide (TPR) repeat protein
VLNGRPLFACLAAALGLVSLLVSGAARAGQPESAIPARDPETRDRIQGEALAALTAGPAGLIGRGRVAEAERAFEALLARQPPGTPAVSDHLTSFGLALFMAEDRNVRLRSIAYFRRAVAAARATFGPNHPELALTLNTYADAQTVLWPDDPPREADAALTEAYRIRLAALGAGNMETLANLIALADVTGLPSRTGGDGARIEAAAALYREAVRNAANRRGAAYGFEYNDFAIYLRLARMYACNGRLEEAEGAVQEAIDAFDIGTPHSVDSCVALFAYGARVVDVLVGRREESLADEIQRRLGFLDQCAPAPGRVV